MPARKKTEDTPDLFGSEAKTDSKSEAKKTSKLAAQKPSKSASQASPKKPSSAKPKAPSKKSGEYSAADIEVLEGLEPVRRRPGMYIGGTDHRALHHLFAEVIDNSMDEAVAGHASLIEVNYEADGTLTVGDNGRGIPVDPHPKFKDKSALDWQMRIVQRC